MPLPTYDETNLFAKIMRGEIPSFKIFETEHAFAMLDVFPMAEGHALLLPKAPCVSVLDMPPSVASAFLAELPRLAKIVQEATGAPSVQIRQNSGEEAGQIIFHCHFHVVPRWPDDKGANKSSKDMLSAEKALPFLAKLAAADGVPDLDAPYAATLGNLDALITSLSAGTVTPPPPPPAPAKAAPAAKAAAPAAKAAPPAKPAPPAAPVPAAAAAPAKGGGEVKPTGDAPPKQQKKEKAKPTEEEIAARQAAKAAEPPKEKKQNTPKGGGAPKAGGGDAEAAPIDISWADIRVGKIVDAKPHPDSDKLYVETIDLGEEQPRQILSGLAQHMPLDAVKGAMVVCICNLKARKIGGLESAGMVLCASDASKSKLCFVTPPAGATAGDRVSFEGFTGEPAEIKKMDKKKGWEAIQPQLNTNADGICCYRDAPFTLSGGVCTGSVPNGIIS